MTKKKWILFGVGIMVVVCILCGIISVAISDNEEINSETVEVVPTVFQTEIVEVVPTQILDKTYDCLQDNYPVKANVIEVVDGDTIKVDIEGIVYTVRYIGIDTPETKHPSKPVEFFGAEASKKNEELLKDRKVLLFKDISETDKYNRLLRYVFVENMFINYQLVYQGYAYSSSYPPDVSCSELFLEAQQSAKDNLRGLWLEPTEEAETEVQKAVEEGREGCDSSYPTVCIPNYPPDLNCGDISYKRFKVEGSDPHGFDRDGNGIGCES